MQWKNIEKGEFSLPIEDHWREKKCEEQAWPILLQLQEGTHWKEESQARRLHPAEGVCAKIGEEWDQAVKLRDI